MKKILVVYDSEGWSFHHIALQIQKYLSDEYEIRGMRVQALDLAFCAEASAVICLWYGGLKTFLQGRPCHAPWQKPVVPLGCKILACIYDEVLRWGLWVDPAEREDQYDCDLLERQAIREADRVLLANRGLDRRLFPDMPEPRSIGLCKDGVDEALFPYRPFRPDFWDLNTPLRLGWTGNTNPEYFGAIKGLNLIQEAVRDLPGVTLVAHDRHTMGLLPHEKMSDWYAGIDLYCCFSACEGTPNPILEASATGRPWLSTDVGIVAGINDTARRLHSPKPPGLILPRESAILRAALEKLKHDRERLARMGAAGWRAIQAEWLWSQRVEQFRTALHELGV